MQENAVRSSVHWKERANLAEFRGREVVLLFNIDQAVLYSYRFARDQYVNCASHQPQRLDNLPRLAHTEVASTPLTETSQCQTTFCWTSETASPP